MKKSLLTIILIILCSLSLNAQVYLGGSLGFNHQKESTEFSLYPEIGFCINDKHSISLVVGTHLFKYNESSPYDFEDWSFYIAPCYTYAIGINDKWSLDLNTTIGYTTFFNGDKLYGLYFGPQIEYSLTEHWALWGAFDVFSFEYPRIYKDYNDEQATANINVNWFNTGINFGFYYYF